MFTQATISIVLVEDEPIQATVIERTLKAAIPAVDVRVAGTLAAYRQAVAARPPDLAIMDLNLPDGCAMEVLINPPEMAPFPIVIMSGYGNEHIAVEALKSGALDYVVKSPKAFANMPKTAANVLGDWKLRQERKNAFETQRQRILELENMLAGIKIMRGLLTICAGCKKIKDGEEGWRQLEVYIQKHSEASFSHSMCPECAKEYYHRERTERANEAKAFSVRNSP